MKRSAFCFALVFLFSFTSSISKVIGLEPSGSQEQFQRFLQLIPEGKLPINITFENLKDDSSIKEIGRSNFLSRKIFSLKKSIKMNRDDRSQGRLNWKFLSVPSFKRVITTPIPICRFQPSEDKFAIIIADGEGKHPIIYLKIFNKEGKKLDTQMIASSDWNILTSISSNFLFEQKEYQWESNPYRGENGELIGTRKLVSTKYFKINDEGKFEAIMKNCEEPGA